jgi:inosine-uridine nucleoside N-ribohydrolase
LIVMRRVLAVLAVLISAAGGLQAAAPAAAGTGPTRLIIDTDFGQWWDDVAALAAVHAAADQGRVRILGIVSDVANEWNAPAIDALDTWYGRPDIPIGITPAAVPVEQNYSRLLAQNYPHAGSGQDAITLYRRLLRAQPDHSVTVLSIGALTTLGRLSRTDRDLVARKVARTVVMGGQYPQALAPEWNFGLDLDATRAVVTDWPAPIVFDGFEIGSRIFVGNHVCAAHPAGSPVRAVFDLLYGCGHEQTDGTWDPTAVYAAVFGTDGVFRLAGRGGHVVVTADGLNRWAPGGHRQQYLVLTDPARLTHRLDALIDAN